MPKVGRKKGESPHKHHQKVVHPGSRKAVQLTKVVHHKERVERRKSQRQLAVSNQVVKLMWFRDKVDESKKFYTVNEMLELVESYLHRHDEQLDEIIALQSDKSRTSSHYRQQHASKEDTLRQLIVKERELFEGPGFEAPDLTNPKLFKTFLSWRGEEKLLSKLSLRKYIK